MKHIIEDAKRMIRFNSVATNGNEELSNYVAGLLQDRGLKTIVQQVTHSLENVSKRQFNIVGILGDPLVDKKTRKGLLLNSHLDTVSPGLSENWTETGGDPFSALIKDGKIYGLGSADAKIDFLCKLRAVEKFREKKLKMPVYLVGTCGEELGMVGAKYLIKSGALNPKYAVVGEPTELKVVYAHKCVNIFKVNIGFNQVERDARGFSRRIDLHSFGRSSHASYPSGGLNAVEQMLDFLRQATEAGFELRFTRMEGGDSINKVPDRGLVEFFMTSHQFEEFKRFFRETIKMGAKEKAFRVELGGLGDMGVRFLPDAVFKCVTEVMASFRSLSTELAEMQDGSYDPPSSTVSFSQLKQNPSTVEMIFDLRLLPDQSPEELQKKVQAGIQQIAARFPNLNVSAQLERSSPGLTMNFDHELVKICQDAMHAAGIRPVLDKKPTSTEAALFFQAGYESVAFGPGVSQGNSGSPNEHNLLDQMEKAVTFYERLIERVCL